MAYTRLFTIKYFLISKDEGNSRVDKNILWQSPRQNLQADFYWNPTIDSSTFKVLCILFIDYILYFEYYNVPERSVEK